MGLARAAMCPAKPWCKVGLQVQALNVLLGAPHLDQVGRNSGIGVKTITQGRPPPGPSSPVSWDWPLGLITKGVFPGVPHYR